MCIFRLDRLYGIPSAQIFYDFHWWLLLMVLPLSLLPLAIVCSMVPLDDFSYALADFPQSTTICDDFPGPCCHLMISPSLGALVVSPIQQPL